MSARAAIASAWLGLLGPAAPAGAEPADVAARLLEGARVSIERAPRYDPSYARIAYPGGDPGWGRGACVDVVIRAFRHAGVDLQVLVHEDVLAARRAYRIAAPDANIDHRRCRNLKVLFERHAATVPLVAPSPAEEPPAPGPPGDWRAGDLVIWDLFGGASPNHIGIVSDRIGGSGLPFVIHHFKAIQGFSGRPSEDDCLTRWRILGHYRWETSGDPGALEAP